MKRCGACGQKFNTAQELMKHLKECKIATEMKKVVDIVEPIKAEYPHPRKIKPVVSKTEITDPATEYIKELKEK